MLTTYAGQAGTGLHLYFLSLTFASAGDSVTGTWSLAYQTTCQTQDGTFRGARHGAALSLMLEADQPTEASFAMRLSPASNGAFRGQVLSATPGTNPLCFQDFASITLSPGNGL